MMPRSLQWLSVGARRYHRGDIMSIALLIVRLVFGLGLAAHGAQKLFGWFGGHGLSGTGGFFEQLGFRPGRLFATLAGAGEFVAGLLVALGVLGPIGPALMIVVMIVAMITVHVRNGFFVANNGIEVPLLYATAALGLVFTGFGRLSLDAALHLRVLPTRHDDWIVVAIAIVIALANLVARRPAPPTARA